jgi:hypothetical protein
MIKFIRIFYIFVFLNFKGLTEFKFDDVFLKFKIYFVRI